MPRKPFVSTTNRPSMNVVFRFVSLLILLLMEADGLVFQPRMPHPSSTQRHLQHEENESDPAATDFLAEVSAAILKDDPTNKFSNFAAFIDALVARAAASNESHFYSNWSNTADRSEEVSVGPASAEEDAIGSDFTPFPELSSMDADTDASVTFDQVANVSSSFSASGGDLENTIGDDVTMTDGEDSSDSVTVMQLSSGIIVSFVAFGLTLQMYA